MKLAARALLVEALRDFRRTWPQLILTDLLARALAVVLLTPAVGLLLKVFLATTSTGVVTDEAIVGFLLHPSGLAALLMVCTVSLAILFAETGQLMVIGFASIEDRYVSWLDALTYAFGRLAGLMQLAWLAVTRLLLISLPCLAGLGALYGLLLGSHDINYYLTEKPPEFLAAALLGGLVLAVTAAWVLLRIAGWLLALPMVLFEHVGGRQAMLASQEAAVGRRGQIVLWLVEWIVAVVLLSGSVTYVFGRLGDLLISREGSNLALLLAGLCAVLVGSWLAGLAVTVFTTVLFPLLLVRLYCSVGRLGELRPEIAARGTLREKASFRIPGKAILLAAAAVVVMVAGAAYLAMRHLDTGDPVQIIAHRGGAAVAPENTMAAFKRGIADGADWLELDVQENADGVVVIQHDRDFMRVAGVNLEVWKATNADLTHMDVGSSFDPAFLDQRVPTLRQVLELARGRAGLFIELKYYGHDRNLEAKVVDLVEATDMVSDIVIMSLLYDGVLKTAELRPTWAYGVLNAVAIGDLTRLDVDFLALTAKAASYRTIRSAHRRGMKVYAWTVDDPVQMSVMMSRGVDGIITNQVALARQVQALREQLTPLGRLVLWMAGESGLLRGMEKSSVRDDA